MTIGIWHKSRSGLPELMRRIIAVTPELCGSKAEEMPEWCDVMISDGPVPDALRPCRCRLAILPGDTALDLRFLTADRVVTYGMSRLNTVTISSVGDDRLFLALQREIVGLTGKRLERQELVVRHAPGAKTAMAATAALLACGAEPESLETLFDRHIF